jgi:hypothetical protein
MSPHPKNNAYNAGWDYWVKNRPWHALTEGLILHARSCGWHDKLTWCWLDGFFDAKITHCADVEAANAEIIRQMKEQHSRR